MLSVFWGNVGEGRAHSWENLHGVEQHTSCYAFLSLNTKCYLINIPLRNLLIVIQVVICERGGC